VLFWRISLCYNTLLQQGRILSDETNLSAENPAAFAGARLYETHDHHRWAHCAQATSAQEAASPHGLTLVLSRSHRLRKNRDFRKTYSRGRSYVNAVLALHVAINRDGGLRFGFTVGKKLGKAVERNRIKRRLRESCRALMPQIISGHDLVFVARTALTGADYQTIAEGVRSLLLRADLLLTNPSDEVSPAGEE
jgi:ribonuclease P protein component